MNDELSDLEASAVDFVRERDYVSFVELQRHLESEIPVKGDYAVEICKNGILWPGVSREFCDLVVGLLSKKKIFHHPASRMVYLIDGCIPSMQSPKQLPKDGIHVGYEQPVWLPVCFRTTPYDSKMEKRLEQQERAEKQFKDQEVQAIVEATKRLIGRFGAHKVDEAYVKATLGDVKKAWTERYGLKEAKGPVCCMRLLGKKCREFNSRTGRLGDCECKPPASDHATLWTYEGKPAVYVFQPYGLTGDKLEDLMDYCKKWGLQADIDTYPAWHYQGHVLFVAISPKVGVYEDLGMGRIKPAGQKPEPNPNKE